MIPQGARATARVDRVANGTAFADVHDGNGNELVHGGRWLTTNPSAEPYRPRAVPATPCRGAIGDWPLPRHSL